MEGSKNKILILMVLMVFPIFIATAQKKDLGYYQCAFFESYRAGNMAPWPGLIAEMENVKSADLAWQTELLKAIYGLVGYQIGSGEKDMAKVNINKADGYLDKLLDNYPRDARLTSLSSSFYAYKMALAFYKAPFLGPKCLYLIGKSIELDPSEPMGYIEKGNSLMFRPAIIGGDKKQAIALYQKALKLMEANGNPKCNWQHLLLQAFILKGLYETNQTSEAKAFYLKIQKDNGSIDWVKKYVGAEWFK
jgi:tetratricopeptide (TPR) repeat protein